MNLQLFENPRNVRFDDLVNFCARYSGKPRIKGSHFIFKMPWAGNPRINLQKDGNWAKAYQVREVAKAVERLEEEYGKK